jgi:ferredoxin
MTTTITVQPLGQSFGCAPGWHLLDGVERSGTKASPVGCRRGGCGVCRVRVIDGQFNTKVMSKAYCTEHDIAAGEVLACRVFPTTDLVVEPCPKTKTLRSSGEEAGPADHSHPAIDQVTNTQRK